MKNFTPEMIEKAKAAKSAEELLEVAKAGGIEMTADEAATYFAQLNPQSGELDDDALDGVAGGCGGSSKPENRIEDHTRVRVINGKTCPNCGGTEGEVYNASYGIPNYVACTSCQTTVNQYTIFDKWDGYFEIGVDIELI